MKAIKVSQHKTFLLFPHKEYKYVPDRYSDLITDT